MCVLSVYVSILPFGYWIKAISFRFQWISNRMCFFPFHFFCDLKRNKTTQKAGIREIMRFFFYFTRGEKKNIEQFWNTLSYKSITSLYWLKHMQTDLINVYTHIRAWTKWRNRERTIKIYILMKIQTNVHVQHWSDNKLKDIRKGTIMHIKEN